MVAGCDMASAAGLLRDATRYPVMFRLHIETFRAANMIVASSGQIPPTSGHDHENRLWARPVGHDDNNARSE
jgi:hypothetical protein